MGVDFYPCSRCGSVYCDCGYFTTCSIDAGGCGRDWCGDKCAERDGYRECSCKLGKELNSHEAYCEDGCDKYKDRWDSCSSVDCPEFVSASCIYCRNEEIEDGDLLRFALSKLNITREELIKEYNSERNTNDA